MMRRMNRGEPAIMQSMVIKTYANFEKTRFTVEGAKHGNAGGEKSPSPAIFPHKIGQPLPTSARKLSRHPKKLMECTADLLGADTRSKQLHITLFYYTRHG